MQTTIQFIAGAIVTLAALSAAFADDHPPTTTPLFEEVDAYLHERAAEFDRIPSERKASLETFAQAIAEDHAGADPVRLVFICTHNSRRSHMAQLWTAAAMAHENIGNIETFSGGTEATAFNPRAVAAMKRAGFRIHTLTPIENPRYQTRFGPSHDPITSFSKTFEDDANPQDDFTAVMVCDSADEACPFVPGADRRIAITYVDPKLSDGTPEEAATYDERCAQIAREMLYVAKQVAAGLE